MEKFSQILQPIGDNIYLSALVALIPIVYYLVALAGFKLKGWLAGLTTLILAIIIACIFFKMPVSFALATTGHGVVYGLLPIGWIILASVFLYKMTVHTGHFNIIRDSVTSLTDDRRIQTLLIAFSFSAFLEGSAGFGAPVAISAALLVGLGFRPLYAAGLALVANTAPVAFGAVGIPIIAVNGIGTYANGNPITALEISAMVGNQLPIIAIITPFYVVFIMAGFKKTLEVLPAILVSGGSFAIAQYFSAVYLGPDLPAIVSSIVSLVATVILLKFWKPKTTWKFKDEEATSSDYVVQKHSLKEVIIAWSPFLVLIGTICLWTLKSIKAIFAKAVIAINIPLIHKNIINSLSGKEVAAVYKLDIIGATGTAIIVAAIISKFIIKISWSDMIKVFVETFNEIKFALLTICFVVGFAYVMNSSGMTNTLGSALAATGKSFAVFSSVLGWLGVFITGSDTSSNLLFTKLQEVTANGVGINPLLTVAANATGGVAGKMISPQSIAVAAAAVGLVGKESELLKFTFKHSVMILIIICIIVYAQSTGLFSWMIPTP